MKVWDVTISGHEETKYHKGILLGDFNEFIEKLKGKMCFCDKLDRSPDVKCQICRQLNNLGVDALVGEGEQ